METFELGNPDSEIVLIQPVDEHDLEMIENEAAIIKNSCNKDFYLIAVKIHDWNNQLSPWEAPAVFGKVNFGNGAPKTLSEIIELCTNPEKTFYIGGYSLAGLFSLWAAYKTDVFSGVAAASPSMWFPGFIDYMKTEKLYADRIYLSLGNKEEKARNPVMATVGNKMRKAYELLQNQGINSLLEWNEGNHFKEADVRTAKAFSWIINN